MGAAGGQAVLTGCAAGQRGCVGQAPYGKYRQKCRRETKCRFFQCVEQQGLELCSCWAAPGTSEVVKRFRAVAHHSSAAAPAQSTKPQSLRKTPNDGKMKAGGGGPCSSPTQDRQEGGLLGLDGLSGPSQPQWPRVGWQAGRQAAGQRRRSQGWLWAAVPGSLPSAGRAGGGSGTELSPGWGMEALGPRCLLPTAQGCPRPGCRTVLLVSGSGQQGHGFRGAPGGQLEGVEGKEPAGERRSWVAASKASV